MGAPLIVNPCKKLNTFSANIRTKKGTYKVGETILAHLPVARDTSESDVRIPKLAKLLVGYIQTLGADGPPATGLVAYPDIAAVLA